MPQVSGIRFSTGSAWANTFRGLLDGFVVVLADGSTHTVDFEGPGVALTGPTPAYINALGSTRVSVTVTVLDATGLTAGIKWWVCPCCAFGRMTERGGVSTHCVDWQSTQPHAPHNMIRSPPSDFGGGQAA